MSYPALGFPPPDDGRGPDGVGRIVDYPEDTPPPGGRRTPWVVAAVAAVVLLGLGALFVVTDRRSTRTDDGTTTVAVPPLPPPFPPPSATLPPLACDPAVPGAQTPAGWQTVSSDVGLTYDVPPDWTVEGCDVRLGWERECANGIFGTCPVQILRAGAHRESAVCPDDWRAVSGLDSSPRNPRDLNRTVREKARLVAEIYTSDDGQVPGVSLTEPRALILDGTPALQIVATVTGMEPEECSSPSAVHSVVAITSPGQEGAVVFVVSLDQDVPDAPRASVLDDLVATLRHS